MRLRSSVHAGCAMATATTLLFAPAALPEPETAPPVGTVRLAATASAIPAAAPPGALISQFLVNQLENCSLICPFIVQLAIEPTIKFAIIPATFAAELQSGQPLLKAIALTDATVSGAANAALTGIIDNDLGLVLPRAQNALEVAVIGLIGIGTTAVTQPGDLIAAVSTARADFLAALKQPPGTMPPPTVHNELEAAAVRTIEVISALTFQAPERLLLGVTQAADAFFSTVGATGNVGSGLTAAGASVATTIDESVAFVRHALTEPIPISASAATTAVNTSDTRPSAAAQLRTATTKPDSPVVNSPRRISKPDSDTPAKPTAKTKAGSAKPDGPAKDGVGRRHDDDRSGPSHRDTHRTAKHSDG